MVLAMTAMVVASVPKNNQEAKQAELEAKGEPLTVPKRYDLPALHVRVPMHHTLAVLCCVCAL